MFTLTLEDRRLGHGMEAFFRALVFGGRKVLPAHQPAGALGLHICPAHRSRTGAAGDDGMLIGTAKPISDSSIGFHA
jgi:hypothetical protein